MSFTNILSNWLLTLIIGIPSLLIIYLLTGKKAFTEKKVEEREYLIPSTAVSQSWRSIMIVLIFGTIYDFFPNKIISSTPYKAPLYLLTGLVVYAISYYLNRKRYS